MGVESPSTLASVKTGALRVGVAWVSGKCWVKSYIRVFSGFIMAIVGCPFCSQEVDLGHIELFLRDIETYECPYCLQEFEWSDDDEMERIESLELAKVTDIKANALVQSVNNRDAEQNYKFPLLVGNLKARWEVTIEDVIGWTIMIILWPILVLLITYTILHGEFMRMKYKREFSENILNPAYLRGTGLVVFPDLSAVLVAKRRVPEYVFEKEDITRIVLHEESYDRRNSDYELKIYLHRFHALTLYGFNNIDSEKMVSMLKSLYDIEFKYSEHYNKPDTGGDGGSGGG